MSVLLDAFALIAFFRGEPAAPAVRAILEHEAPAWTTSIGAAETVDKMVRVFGADGDDIEAQLTMLGVGIEPVDVSTGVLAGRIRAAHYDESACAVSLADCVAVAAAFGAPASLATADASLASIAVANDVDVIELPST